jgi:predicted GNAT superfamily acetyltransferase
MDAMTAQSELAGAAAADAAAAAHRSAVTVRLLHDLADLEAMTALIDGIWRPDTGSPLVSVELLRALSHAGNYVAGAFDRAAMLGACVGFLAAPPGAALHSHIAGVSAAARGRSVGFALKLHQREWALERGLTTVTWTADPLVRRNAYFNIVKLGALPADYLVEFYGDIGDAVNAGQATDRLLFRWDVASAAVAAACARRQSVREFAEWREAGAVAVLAESAAGGPEAVGGPTARAARTVLVQVPLDIEALRQHGSRLAREWRHAVRDVLGGLLAAGGRVAGFTRSGWYVVEKETQ